MNVTMIYYLTPSLIHQLLLTLSHQSQKHKWRNKNIFLSSSSKKILQVFFCPVKILSIWIQGWSRPPRCRELSCKPALLSNGIFKRQLMSVNYADNDRALKWINFLHSFKIILPRLQAWLHLCIDAGKIKKFAVFILQWALRFKVSR